MKFEFHSKSLEYDPDLTKVILTTAEGGNVPVYLSADLINLTNQELFEKALDTIYEVNFPMRAENEKFNTMGEKIAQVDDAIDRVNSVAQDVKELSATSRGAFLKVMMKLYEKEVLTDEEMEELGLFDEE
ncbi:DUF1366 domain-containing protein [Streptococcus cuniculi]|uniref:DUF1366 domain-containing protein n=1 Tax=Streptococcus cuniculi TaxID=1432788 RepID=A0A4Y9JBJ7_9STRE|nr:DUF1366 domain-containing protein [Streptococcus cuniculi]MBF0778190.1 DUF1366 domain-containing protein [Streptococcus cuniculi]TFU97931.1 DUF1366 domain-containing protein [Streptococcus cuniculi]